jgi:serine/threonine protein kinase
MHVPRGHDLHVDLSAPEISLGLPYGFPSDVWSFGVIARELVTGRNLYLLRFDCDGRSLEYASLHCGPITNEVWPDVQSAPWYKPPSAQFKPDDWKLKRLRQVDENSLGFVRRILQADPAKRPTAADLVASSVWAQPVSEDRLPRSDMVAAMPSKVQRTSEVAASNGGVVPSHSSQTVAKASSPFCRFPGSYSCGSWSLCNGGKKSGEVKKCLQPTTFSSSYC